MLMLGFSHGQGVPVLVVYGVASCACNDSDASQGGGNGCLDMVMDWYGLSFPR